MIAKKWILILAAASLLLTGTKPAAAASAPYESYNYDFWSDAVAAPAAYLPARSITGAELGIGDFLEPSDMHISESGDTYVLDSGNARIVVLDANWQVKRTIETFDNAGKQDTFKNPGGIFADEDGNIYVADTDNLRVVVLTSEGLLLKVVQNPESDVLAKDFKFAPVKVTVDKAKRMYVVSRGVYEGIMQFDEKGKFLGYVGTIKIRRDYADYFWRLISTKAQKAQMTLFIPTEFSNLDIDNKGFVYATNIDVGSQEPIKRLNPSGEDVLKRFGYFQVQGDLYSRRVVGPSKFVDIKVLGSGMYSGLDTTQGRVFTYDDEGHLLYIFGGKGTQVGTFKTPVAIEQSGDNQVVLDRGKANIIVFEPTAFGKLVNEAVRNHYIGEDKEAVKSWVKVLELNSNYDIAYIGIGKAMLMEKENKQAMSYFKLGMDRKSYSVAYKRYRREVMKEHFGTAMTFLLVAALAFFSYKAAKKWRQRRATGREARFY
ncbi:MAG: NHL repeat-containing protein [Gorillibacterium sp.]|nr:NHL repeat-containing protein [Gorillibacterium sp.]